MNQIKPCKLRLLWYLNFFLLTILCYHAFFSFLWIIDLYCLILTVITQIFNPSAELSIPIEIPTKKAKAENETHLVIAQLK